MPKEKQIERVRIGEYSLCTDTTHNWVIVKHGVSKKGDPTIKTIGYYPKIEGACERLLRIKVMQEDVSDLLSLISATERCKNEIIGALKMMSV